MTAKTTKTLAGEIADLAFKFTAAGAEYAEVDIRHKPDDKYATRTRAFDEALVERFRKARKGLFITLDIQEEQGTYNNRPITYRNIVGILPNVKDAPPSAKLPPAGAPPEAEPFPVAGATKEPPQTRDKGGSTPPEPQKPPSPAPTPIDPSTVAVRTYSYSRTYNLGNFESERFEVEAQMPPGWSDAEAFAHLRERIEAARAALPAGVDARSAAREYQNP